MVSLNLEDEYVKTFMYLLIRLWNVKIVVSQYRAAC